MTSSNKELSSAKDSGSGPVNRRPEQCPQCGFDTGRAPRFLGEGEKPLYCPSCMLPRVIIAGKYLLEKKLGEGGGGIVYSARHQYLSANARRVVKFIRPELLKDEVSLKRFLREIQVTSFLSQENQHVVRIFDDFGKLPELGYFYVMEYLRGQDLEWFFENQKQFSFVQIVQIVEQLCKAMMVAHQANILHRDLKPSNIFLLERPNDEIFLKVMDFGIAQDVRGEKLTSSIHRAVGTPLYMAPEQFVGNGYVDESTDVYAIGTIFYELLAGYTPFLAPSEQKDFSLLHYANRKVKEDAPRLADALPGGLVPDAIERVIMKSIARRRVERFGSVAEFFHHFQMAIELAREDGYLPPVNPKRSSQSSLDGMDGVIFDSKEDLLLPPTSGDAHKRTPRRSPSGGGHGSSPSQDQVSTSAEAYKTTLGTQETLDAKAPKQKERLELAGEDEKEPVIASSPSLPNMDSYPRGIELIEPPPSSSAMLNVIPFSIPSKEQEAERVNASPSYSSLSEAPTPKYGSPHLNGEEALRALDAWSKSGHGQDPYITPKDSFPGVISQTTPEHVEDGPFHALRHHESKDTWQAISDSREIAHDELDDVALEGWGKRSNIRWFVLLALGVGGLLGGMIFFSLKQKTPNAPSLPSEKQPSKITKAPEEPKPRTREVAPVAPERKVALVQPISPPRVEPSVPQPARRKPLMRKRKKVQRVHHKKHVAAGVLQTPGCPPDTEGKQWYRFDLNPKNASVQTELSVMRFAKWICVLQDPKEKISLKLGLHRFKPCQFERRIQKRRVSVRLAAEQENDLGFDPDLDYCLKR
ncbi:MAG: serine/threonine protein kinase [Myxococcales bacterium]|nr:serine/threonine protein kinase [Myxococcales bacterium]